jgi:hypothetical protein
MSIPGNDLLTHVEKENPKLGVFIRRYLYPLITQRGLPGQVLATPPNGVGNVRLQSISSLVPGTPGPPGPAGPAGSPGATGATGPAGASYNFADNEVPAGAINGINVTYTLAHVPNPPASLILANQGLTMWQNAGGDYTLSGATITFFFAPTLGPLIAWYRY